MFYFLMSFFYTYPGHIPLIETLILKHHGDIHLKDTQGKTPIDAARSYGHEDLVQMMMRFEVEGSRKRVLGNNKNGGKSGNNGGGGGGGGGGSRFGGLFSRG
jgi:uncharacterized membrane protein YgcG